MTKLIILAVAMLSLALNVQADGPFAWFPDLEIQGEVIVPRLRLAKDVDMTNSEIGIDLLDNEDPFHCYTSAELGLLNNVSSSIRLYGNCVEAFDSDNCTGQAFRFTSSTPKDCLNYFIHCDSNKNWNDMISSLRICRP